MKITTTSVLIGISAIGVLAFAAYYMKKRKKEKELPAEETANTAPAEAVKPAQSSLARAAGLQRMTRTPVGYVMN